MYAFHLDIYVFYSIKNSVIHITLLCRLHSIADTMCCSDSIFTAGLPPIAEQDETGCMVNKYCLFDDSKQCWIFNY